MNNIPNYSSLSQLANVSITNPRDAKEQLKIIKQVIESFEARLNGESEVALKLTSFGQVVVLLVDKISAVGTSLIIYSGYIDGNWSVLIQHVNQISFLLQAVPKPDPIQPARVVGFD